MIAMVYPQIACGIWFFVARLFPIAETLRMNLFLSGRLPLRDCKGAINVPLSPPEERFVSRTIWLFSNRNKMRLAAALLLLLAIAALAWHFTAVANRGFAHRFIVR